MSVKGLTDMKTLKAKIILAICAAVLTAAAAVITCSAKAGDNIMTGASLYQCTGYINDNEQSKFLFDGNYNTKWCATTDNVKYNDFDFKAQAKAGYIHILGVDFGEAKYFNKYKLYLASTGMTDYGMTDYNASAWTIQISDDGKIWVDVSRVTENYDEDTVTVDLGVRQARYLRILVDEPELTGGSTVRLYELEVYECDAGTIATGVVKTNGSSPAYLETEAPETEAPAADTAADADSEDNVVGYTPSEAIQYEGYKLGANGIAAIITMALLAGVVAYFAARKAGSSGKY
jgi:F5/8 type C domain.